MTSRYIPSSYIPIFRIVAVTEVINPSGNLGIRRKLVACRNTRKEAEDIAMLLRQGTGGDYEVQEKTLNIENLYPRR